MQADFGGTLVKRFFKRERIDLCLGGKKQHTKDRFRSSQREGTTKEKRELNFSKVKAQQ